MLLFYYRLEFDDMDNKKTTKTVTNKNAKSKTTTKRNSKPKVTKMKKVETEVKAFDSKAVTNAGVIIIFISILILIIFIVASGIWSLKLSALPIFTNNTKIGGSGFNAEIIDTKNIDTDKLFNSKYFNTLNLLSDSIAFGTTWLNVCENGQTIYNDDIYVKVCSDEFKSLKDIYDKFLPYVSNDYISELIGDNFIEKDGALYIKPVWIDKNNEYIGFDSYKVEEKTSDKIVYMVKSKYGKLNCTSNCNYSYNDNKFTLVREGNRWVVSNLEMPY